MRCHRLSVNQLLDKLFAKRHCYLRVTLQKGSRLLLKADLLV
jgi:hypothetical protein